MKYKYPEVMGERETLALAFSMNIARFGDAEFRLAAGPPAKAGKTQEHHPTLEIELRRMLANNCKSLICIPRIWPGCIGWLKIWQRFYTEQKWLAQIKQDRVYGSSFISRSDAIQNIDEPAYWDRVRDLWRNQDATLVIGQPSPLGKHYSLVPADLHDARSVRTVYGYERDTWIKVDEIEEEIGKPAGPVILCLGPTATVLAERLAHKGVHALDLGHIGRFMRHSAKRAES